MIESKTTLAERLRLAADDPMWADHAEIPKHWCSEAADTIEALREKLAAAEVALEPLDEAFPPVAQPVAVKPLVWEEGEAHSPVGIYRVHCSNGMWEPVHRGTFMLPREYGTVAAFGTEQEAKDFVQNHYECLVRSALVAVKPAGVASIDLMRDAAKAAILRNGWKHNDRFALHSVIELMAAFAVEVADTGEGRCGWPTCGCDYDASCAEVKHTALVAEPAPQPADERLASAERHIEALEMALRGIRALDQIVVNNGTEDQARKDGPIAEIASLALRNLKEGRDER